MLMASDVAKYLINAIATYGDLPCVLEHHAKEQDGVLLDPLADIPIMTIYKMGTSHKESCILFTHRHVRDDDDNSEGQSL